MKSTGSLVKETEQRAKRAGFTTADLCSAAGVSHYTWLAWRRGETSPPLDKWRAILELLAGKAA